MLVGLLTITLSIPWAHSLKEKPAVMSSLINSTAHKFRISIAESDHQDVLQTGEITVAILASHRKQGDSMLDNVLNYMNSHTDAEFTNVRREFL